MCSLHPHPHLSYFLQIITTRQTAKQNEHVVVPVVETQVLVGTEVSSCDFFSPAMDIEFVKHTFGTYKGGGGRSKEGAKRNEMRKGGQVIDVINKDVKRREE